MNEKNNKCIILGGGSSIKEGIELGLWDKIKGLDVWSLNFAFKFMSFLPTRQLWTDTTFFKNEVLALQDLYKKGVILHTKKHELYDKDIYKNCINQSKYSRNIKKINEDEIYIGQMGLCGMLALSLAVKEQYKTIYLLGYDFGTSSYVDKETHFYLDKVQEFNIKSSGLHNTQVYMDRNNAPNNKIQDFSYYINKGSEILNIGMKSNILYFPQMSWQDFFNNIGENNVS